MRQFSSKFCGYNKEEVDRFILKNAERYNALEQKYNELDPEGAELAIHRKLKGEAEAEEEYRKLQKEYARLQSAYEREFTGLQERYWETEKEYGEIFQNLNKRLNQAEHRKRELEEKYRNLQHEYRRYQSQSQPFSEKDEQESGRPQDKQAKKMQAPSKKAAFMAYPSKKNSAKIGSAKYDAAKEVFSKKIFGDVLFYGILVVLIVAIIFLWSRGGSGAPKSVAGFSAFTVVTGSMEDVIPKDSLVVTRHVAPEKLKVGEDITYFLDPTTTVTHRIVGIIEDFDETGKRAFQTKGTMNSEVDALPVAEQNVVGKVIFHNLFLGKAAIFVERNWPLLICFLLLLAVLIKVLQKILRKDE